MLSVTNNDFELEKNSVHVDEIRVSNDGNEDVSDLNANEVGETRVSSEQDLGSRNEVDETRVSSGDVQEGDKEGGVFDGTNCSVNGDSGKLVSSSGNQDADGDSEIEFRTQDDESEDAKNKKIALEEGQVSSSVDRTKGGTSSTVEGLRDDKIRKKAAICNNGVKTVGITSDNRLEKRPSFRVSFNSDVDGSMKVMGSPFEMGDMIWGKVKSHPWWPGHLFNEALAFNSVRRTRRDGHVLVAFFGDSSYGWFDPTELIPFDPHYAEKSQQTNARTFMKAVEESADEACRRSALGLSCCCRNSSNFRPTKLAGYLAVDVVDYEPGAIYSVNQIQKARGSFHPAETLSFIKQLAASPMSSDNNNISFLKQKATSLAYRRSAFEEFDETYAQAFGHEPERTTQSAQPLTDKEPSRAPLSGPLVMAEALGGRKGSTKVAKPKNLLKKDRYLFKRRGEAGELRTTQTTQPHSSSSSPSTNEDGMSDLAAANYVFQKRDTANDDLGKIPSRDQVAASSQQTSKGLGLMSSPDEARKKFSLDNISDSKQSEPPSAAMTAVTSDVGGHINNISSSDSSLVKKKKKVAKRPAGERSSDASSDIFEKRKKKKLKTTEGERRPVQVATAGREDSPQVGLVSSERAREDEVHLPQMLADLHGLALNPFHGAEGNRPKIARQYFLKFRSLVYLKASSAVSMTELEPGESRAVRSSPAGEKMSSLKPSKLSAKHENENRGVHKRLPSERQEEIAAKRAKKMTQVKKTLTTEKMALSKNPDMVRTDMKLKVGQQTMKTQQQMKKIDRSPRVEDPTYLVMKFQSGSSLPSLVELKARFARFGPMVTSLSRVFYKTNTCRVAFVYKQDANVAYRYAVGSKSVFSNVKFLLRPVSGPEPQQPSTVRAEDSRADTFTNRDSSVVDPRPATPVQLKSCLKKPSVGDESVGPTNGGNTTRAPRVRFNMGEDKGGATTTTNREVVQVPTIESKNVIPSSSSSVGGSFSSSSSVAMDVINNQRFMPSPPLQPPSLPHPSHFPRVPIKHPQHHVEVGAPRNNSNYNIAPTIGGAPSLPPVPLSSIQAPSPLVRPPPPPPPSVDISNQMMNLLTRCHDVVDNVKSMLGYVPYHPL